MLAKSKKYITTEDRLDAEDLIRQMQDLGIFSGKERSLLKIAKNSDAITVDQHRNDLLDRLDHFPYKDRFSERELEMLRYCCKHHDDGKVDELGQKVLHGNPDKSIRVEPHGHLSVLILRYSKFREECPHCNMDDFKICLTAIYNHHTRNSTRKPSELFEYAERYLLHNAQEYFKDSDLKILKKNLTRVLFDASAGGSLVEDKKEYRRYQKIKGMLNLFDYMASSEIDIDEMVSDREKKQLVHAIETKYPTLRTAQKYMKAHSKENLIITGPTGIGKTEGGCLWVDGDKAFYALSIKTASNEIYRRIHDTYGFEDAKILHSGALDVYLSSDDNAYETLESASLLTSPFTVCTVDQLFKFAYQAPGTERAAATLSYSKVIIDELQSCSPETIAAIIYGLVQIVQMGGQFCIMTATLPKFFVEKLNQELDRHDLGEFKPKVKSFTDETPCRHEMEIEDKFDLERIVRESQTKKVLLICNTINKAIQLYEELSEYGAHDLHSRYLQDDRRALEQQIMSFARSDGNGIWITTQLAEASLDIDFDILFTEASTIDSLIQRMGRVYRAGNRKPLEPNVIIIDSDGWKGVYDKDIHKRTMEILPLYENKLLSEEDKLKMVDYVFDSTALRNSDYKQTFEKRYSDLANALPNSYSLEMANELFRDTKDSVSVIPERIYSENRDAIDLLLTALKSRGLSRGAKRLIRSKLQRMTISVNKNSFRKMLTRNLWDDVWAVRSIYDFDKETCKGKGLLKEEESETW